MIGRPTGGLLAAFMALAVLAGEAKADAIDGEWCREGRSFKIDGPNIRTWNGSDTTGDYSRHGFRYKAPAGEPEAGEDIQMTLRNDDMVEVARPGRGSGSRAGEPEIWRRCRVTS